jgi:hypothetical protein
LEQQPVRVLREVERGRFKFLFRLLGMRASKNAEDAKVGGVVSLLTLLVRDGMTLRGA